MSKLMNLCAGAFAAALLLAAPLAAQDTPKSALTAAKKQAAQAVGKDGEARKAELLKAVEMLKEVLKKWPDAAESVAEANLRIGDLLGQCGDKTGAHEAIDRAIQVEGVAAVRAEALLAKASLHRKDKEFEKAKGALKRVIAECAEKEASCAEAMLALASLARREKAWDEMAEFGAKVLEKYPSRWKENVEASDLICGSLIKKKEWQKAQQKLDELDKLLGDRFQQSEKWPSVEKAMKTMTSRRILTADVEGDDDGKD